jgi:2-alkyl-3-oxoalkanoate reductase
MEQQREGGPVIVLVGGAGFVGRAVIAELESEDPVVKPSEVRIFDRHPPNLPETDSGIRYVYTPGDIRDRDALIRSFDGADVVLHLAAIVDWGTHPEAEVHAVNVAGTANVLNACRAAGVDSMVFTSSLDAVCTGKPIGAGDEHLPYPDRFPNSYCRSKAEGERLVLDADGVGGLRTVVLRPAGVYGEADPYHISALVRMARSGFYARIGDGSARCMHVYVGNVAHAHLLAARALLEGRDSLRGKAYFITDSPPENFFRFLDRIVMEAANEIRPRNLWIPKGLMYALGILAEFGALLLRPFKRINPGVSRFAVSYTCNDFIFLDTRLEGDLGYTPKYDVETAVARTVAFFRENGPVDRPEV